MGKKKILIISAAFFPKMSPRSYRTTELALELARQGHDVTVYFPVKNDYADFQKKHGIKIKNLGKFTWKSCRVPASGIGNIVARTVNRFFSLFFNYPDMEFYYRTKNILKKERGYDLLISIAVPHTIHWGVASVWGKNQHIARTWVADCGDPFMGCKTDSFKRPFYFKYIEKWFCRKADYITIPFEGAKAAYYPEFHSKIRIIPQGFSFDNIVLPGKTVNKPTPMFAYCGGFIKDIRDPRPFMEYLCSLAIDFKFIVFAESPQLILPYCDRLKEKLVINNYIPREKLLPVLSQMDFLINFDNNTGAQLPSKLIDYAFTGRPILNITSVLNRDTIDAFMHGDYSHRMIIENTDKYNITNVASSFVALKTKE